MIQKESQRISQRTTTTVYATVVVVFLSDFIPPEIRADGCKRQDFPPTKLS